MHALILLTFQHKHPFSAQAQDPLKHMTFLLFRISIATSYGKYLGQVCKHCI